MPAHSNITYRSILQHLYNIVASVIRKLFLGNFHLCRIDMTHSKLGPYSSQSNKILT